MKKIACLCVVTLIFALGFSFGTVAAKKPGVDSSAWQGASPEEAADRILELSAGFAGNDSWENIHLARVQYLAGDQEEAEARFARFSGPGAEAGDLIRIARVYAQANEWEKAKPLFDRVVELEPKDEDWLVEVGAYYNLNGDREHAEELFERGFDGAPRALYNALTAAGSYVGVEPRKR